MPNFLNSRSREEMVLADMHLKPGEPWDICPRDALHRVSKILKDEFNLVMSAGFENEFYLLKSVQREGKEEWTPFDLTPYCSTSSFDLLLPYFMKLLLPSSLAHSCGKAACRSWERSVWIVTRTCHLYFCCCLLSFQTRGSSSYCKKIWVAGNFCAEVHTG